MLRIDPEGNLVAMGSGEGLHDALDDAIAKLIKIHKDKKTLTVRNRGTNVEKEVMYDDSTRWVSQEHGSKKVNDIDASQVSDTDRIICLGSYDKSGRLHATMISKRLTQ